MHTTTQKHRRISLIAPALVAITAITLVGCSKSSTKSTDSVAADTTAAATADKTAPAADTRAAAAETVAAETAAAADTVAVAADTASAGAATDALAGTFVTEMLKGMNGGKEPSADDVKCVTGKVTSDQLSSLVKSASGGGTPDGMIPIMQAIFTCKPAGLADSLVTGAFKDVPADVDATKKSCIANKLLDFIASDETMLKAMVAGGKSVPEGFKTKGIDIVKECVPAGASRDKLIAEVQKAS